MLDAHRYPQRDIYHLARNTRIPDSQLPACWQGKPLRDLPPRDSFESVFRTLAAAIPLESPCNIIILHADLSRARRRSHIHTLHQQTIHGHTSYHLLHLPKPRRSERKSGRGHLALVHQQTKTNHHATYRTPEQIRDLRTLVGGPTYYLEPPHKKPIKPRPATLRKLLPFHNRPWYIDPKQRPPLHAPTIEHLPTKTHSIGARATRGEGILPSHNPQRRPQPRRSEGILPSYKNHPTNPPHDPKVPTDLKALKVLKVLPLLHTHQKEGKMPSLRPPPPTQNRRHPPTFLIPNSSFLIGLIPPAARAH